MKKKIFALVIDNERLSLNLKNLKYHIGDIVKFIPDDIETYFIDITNLHLIKKKQIEIDVKKFGFKYFSPKNFKELYDFSKKKEILYIPKIKENFRNLRLNFLINIICSKRITINVQGFFLIADKIENFSFSEKINVFMNIKLPYYFYRIASTFRLVAKIDILIIASKNNIDEVKKGISNRIKNKIGIDFSYFKKIYRVNSDTGIHPVKRNITQNFIVFCDSGFDHGDSIVRDGPRDEVQREEYYQKVHNLLSYLEILLNKKAVFCQHPKADYPKSENFEKIKESFHTIKFETEKYIDEAYLVIFISSMSISYAIALKKKIILIHSILLGSFFQLRHSILNKEIELFKIDLDKEEYKMIDKIKLNNELTKNINNYNKFIDENLVTNSKISHNDQIKEILNKEFFKT